MHTENNGERAMIAALLKHMAALGFDPIGVEETEDNAVLKKGTPAEIVDFVFSFEECDVEFDNGAWVHCIDGVVDSFGIPRGANDGFEEALDTWLDDHE